MSTQVVDYGTLTDAELNFEIAKRLGDGNEYENAEHYARLADLLYAPSFATDANAALELVNGCNYNVSHDAESNSCIVRIVISDDSWHSISGDSIPRTICECWLRVQDAKNVSDTH